LYSGLDIPIYGAILQIEKTKRDLHTRRRPMTRDEKTTLKTEYARAFGKDSLKRALKLGRPLQELKDELDDWRKTPNRIEQWANLAWAVITERGIAIYLEDRDAVKAVLRGTVEETHEDALWYAEHGPWYLYEEFTDIEDLRAKETERWTR
jgi:hypothetical protein